MKSLDALDGTLSKELITLEDEAAEVPEKTSCVLLALDCHNVVNYCSVEETFPPHQNGKYQVKTGYPAIGAISFRHNSGLFFVMWGIAPRSKAWCAIYSLAEIRAKITFIDHNSVDENAITKKIIEHVKNNRYRAHTLTELFGDSFSQYELLEETPDASVVIGEELAISPSFKTVEFIGRKLRVIKLLATPIEAKETNSAKGSWMRRLQTRRKGSNSGE